MNRRLLLAVLAVTGCATPFRQAIDAADQALEHGDLPTAVEQYQRACRLEPKDESCVRAAQLEVQLVNETLAEAAPHCRAGASERCLELLAGARRVSGRPELTQLANLAGDAHVQRCAAIGLESLESTVDHVRCLEALRKEVGTAQYGAAVDRERDVAGQAIASTVSALSTATPARAWMVSRLARCVSRTAPVGDAIQQLGSSVAQEQRVPLHVAVGAQADPSPGLCEFLAQRARGRFSCVETQQADAVGLLLELNAAPTQHTVFDTPKSLEYLAAQDVSPNPDYLALEREAHEQKELIQYESRALVVAKADCETAEGVLKRAKYCATCEARTQYEGVCNRANALQERQNEQRERLQQLHHKLKLTNSTITTNRYDTFRYVERSHHWAKRITFVGRVVRANDTLTNRDSVTETEDGTEHVGFEPAGLAPRGVAWPSDEALQAKANDAFTEFAWQTAALELSSRADAQQKRCGRDTEECWVRAQWYLADDVFVPWMAWLKQRVDARGAGFKPFACVQ